ncbi:MAG TPA: M15 family metallopeptidase [Sandaracinaceae bacterium LLY-WYZ-13_1]|nr:M15 family metallopeptidase [Sandaracinaceae bacterium LLY-WYZ-13_1]
MRAPTERRPGRARWCLAAAAWVLTLGSAAAAQDLPAMCTGLSRPDARGRFVARADLLRDGSSLDGDDPLALVNRTPAGALPPDYAPDDLVDLATMRAARWWECTPPRKQCLRRDAARAYRALAEAMERAGLRPHVSSAFRAYRVQCSTFGRWTERGGFCAASSASALPGHSQHQLGTTVDLFTRDWMDGGDKFRAGYGCSPGGRWLAAHAAEHGFVLPYPLHPDYRREGSACAAVDGAEARIDPRTGYRYEPWHLRWVGAVNAARFGEAREAADGPITLEQWLRAERGDPEPVGAPVCDGCNCDRCATFARDEDRPCERPAMALDAAGRPRPAAGPPTLLDARLERDGSRVRLVARVRVPPNTWTQPPVVTPASGAHFRRGRRSAQLADRPPRRFEAHPGAWRLAVGFGAAEGYWPWKVALVDPSRDGTANGVDARIPAAPGELELRISMARVAPGTLVRVGVASTDEVRTVRRLEAP